MVAMIRRGTCAKMIMVERRCQKINKRVLKVLARNAFCHWKEGHTQEREPPPQGIGYPAAHRSAEGGPEAKTNIGKTLDQSALVETK